MIHETYLVFGIIAAAGALMASNRVRFDVVALMVVLTLILTGILTIDEALSGFGSQVVALVAGLLVVGEMLSRTGVARVMGDWVLKHGQQSEIRLLVLIMSSAALLGSVMSSTVVVALFIPVVLRITAATQLNASRMLIPLSYASLISGMLTLIATTPNIVVHEQLKGAGFDGFGFFSFSLVGIAVLLVAMGYIILVGRHLLGKPTETASQRQSLRSVETLWHEHNPHSTYQKLRISEGSPLEGLSIADSQIESQYQVRVIGVLRRTLRGRKRILSPDPSVELLAGTTVLVLGRADDISRLVAEQSLKVLPQNNSDRERWLWDISGAAVLIHPESKLVDKSLREIGFRSTYGVHVLGVRRNFKPLDDYSDVQLKPADSIFVVGSWAKIQQLTQKSHDFVVTEFPREHGEAVRSYKRLNTSLLILGAMVLLTLFDIVPLVVAVGLAALAAVFTRCLTMEDAYRSVSWSSLVLIAGMLPLAEALKKTGGTELIASLIMSASGGASPYVLMTLVFFLTASIGLVLSNTAAAVLVSPIAIYTAQAAGLSPYPFAVAVVIAASSAFSTPVATPVVSLVVEPGRYKFIDFIRTGLPLLLLTYLTTLAVTPLLFPF